MASNLAPANNDDLFQGEQLPGSNQLLLLLHQIVQTSPDSGSGKQSGGEEGGWSIVSNESKLSAGYYQSASHLASWPQFTDQ